MNPAGNEPIRVLVVEDSLLIAEFLTHVLSADPQIEIVGIAVDGKEAVEAVLRLKPDVITMDIHMPRMNGFEATRAIMETCPTPIVIVSGSSTADEISTNFQALEAGALAVTARPAGIGHSDHDRSAGELVDIVKLMSEIKVVKRWKTKAPEPASTQSLKMITPPRASIQVVAIGASTGGPMTLQTILARLSKDFPVPILVVQHMTPGFTEGFVEWLAYSTHFPVQVARAGEPLLPGHAYVSPDNVQMGISYSGRIVLVEEERENGMRPSVSFLFRSVEAAFGSHVVGVLLTGMGIDGVEELKNLKEAGAITIAQDEESSVVHGMPGQAIKIGAALHVLSPANIARALTTLVTKS